MTLFYVILKRNCFNKNAHHDAFQNKSRRAGSWRSLPAGLEETFSWTTDMFRVAVNEGNRGLWVNQSPVSLRSRGQKATRWFIITSSDWLIPEARSFCSVPSCDFPSRRCDSSSRESAGVSHNINDGVPTKRPHKPWRIDGANVQ